MIYTFGCISAAAKRGTFGFFFCLCRQRCLVDLPFDHVAGVAVSDVAAAAADVGVAAADVGVADVGVAAADVGVAAADVADVGVADVGVAAADVGVADVGVAAADVAAADVGVAAADVAPVVEETQPALEFYLSFGLAYCTTIAKQNVTFRAFACFMYFFKYNSIFSFTQL